MFKKEFIKNLAKMVEFKTVFNQPGQIKKQIDFVKKYFDKTDVKIKEIVRNDITSLIVSNTDDLSFDILYCTHLDVVEAEADQFEMKVEGDKVFGRGVADDKGPALIGMMLAKEILPIEKNNKIGFLFATDEEIGSENGVDYLVNKLGLKAKVVLLPDAGENHELIQACKGFLHLEIKAMGKEAHGSRPWFGDNAIEKLIQFFIELKKMFPADFKDKNYWQNSMNIGMFNGGKVTNQVPEKAEIGLDIRYVTNEDREQIKAKIKQLTDSIKGVEVNIQQGEMMFLDLKSPYVKQVNKIAKKVLGKELTITQETGATDGRHFSTNGMDVLAFAPAMENIHGKGEWLSLVSAEDYYNIAKEFIKDFK